jgi:hypothetical protein
MEPDYLVCRDCGFDLRDPGATNRLAAIDRDFRRKSLESLGRAVADAARAETDLPYARGATNEDRLVSISGRHYEVPNFIGPLGNARADLYGRLDRIHVFMPYIPEQTDEEAAEELRKTLGEYGPDLGMDIEGVRAKPPKLPRARGKGAEPKASSCCGCTLLLGLLSGAGMVAAVADLCR